MTEQLVQLRASSLPMAFTCPGSVRPPKVKINPDNEAARLGTAVHEVLQPLAEGRPIVWDGIAEIAARWGVNVVELKALTAVAARLWGDVHQYFPNAMSEVACEIDFGWIKLTGHVDLVSIAVDVARAGDWKSGRKDSNYAQQFRGYGALILKYAEHLREVTVTGLWLRTREIENYTMDRAELERWIQEFRDKVVNWDGVYHPSDDHCPYCPRFLANDCPAGTAMARQAIAVMSDLQLTSDLENDIERFSADELIDLKKKVAFVRNSADRVDDAIRARTITLGGIVGTKEQIIVENSAKREIDPQLAWPVLEAAGFTDADKAAVIKISASAIDEVVASRTARGGKKAAIQLINEQLELAGALTRVPQERVSIRRI